MPRFYFVLLADNILMDRQGAEPVVGFVAMRESRAATEEEALKLAKIQLLKEWKHTFNQNNRSGTPALSAVYRQRIRNPLKKVKASDDFDFFSDNDARDRAVEKAVNASRRWFVIRS